MTTKSQSTVALYYGDKWLADTDEIGMRLAVKDARFCGRSISHSEYGAPHSGDGLRIVLRMPGGYVCEALLACQGDDETLQALQGAVTMPTDPNRGVIEIVPPAAGLYQRFGGKSYTSDTLVFLDHEEGKMLDYPPNLPVFTERGLVDVIVGPIVAVGRYQSEFTSLTDEQVEYAKYVLLQHSIRAASQ